VSRPPEHGNETFGSINGGEFLGLMNVYKVSKNSDPWSYLSTNYVLRLHFKILK
jgi:hypothetical protein